MKDSGQYNVLVFKSRLPCVYMPETDCTSSSCGCCADPGEWKSSLCGCCADCAGCCACVGAHACPWYFIAKNVNSMQQSHAPTDILPECQSFPGCIPLLAGVLYAAGFYGAIATASVMSTGAYGGLLCPSVCMHAVVRHAIRRRYKINSGCCDTCCGDFCCALWCYSCALTQENRLLANKITVRNTCDSMFEGVPLLNPTYESSMKL